LTHPLVHPEVPHVAVASGCTLGEGALWDHRTGTVLWVDIKRQSIWRYQPETGHHWQADTPEPVGFVALTPDDDIVIAGFKSGLVRVHLWGGEMQPLVSPEPGRPGNRINDGCVGPDGALYFGTMDDAEKEPTGSFWRWDGETLTRLFTGFVVTNGPAFSPNGRTIYTVDSTDRTIYAHEFMDGVPGASRVFVRFEAGWGHPDGLAVDAEGFVWACHWGASRITRFAPDGSAERVLPVPTAEVTKCAFGGPDLTTLYITTASVGHDPHIDPMAGQLFRVATGIRGLKANIFG
jgi:sugar lactone lactonase YvrE